MHRSIPGSLVSHSMRCYLLCSYCSSEGLASPLCALHSVVGGHSALRRTVCTRAECPGGHCALGQDVRGTSCPPTPCPRACACSLNSKPTTQAHLHLYPEHRLSTFCDSSWCVPEEQSEVEKEVDLPPSEVGPGNGATTDCTNWTFLYQTLRLVSRKS